MSAFSTASRSTKTVPTKVSHRSRANHTAVSAKTTSRPQATRGLHIGDAGVATFAAFLRRMGPGSWSVCRTEGEPKL